MVSWWYHYGTSVFCCWDVRLKFCEHRGDWLSIKFCENDSFRKLFLFFENTFQYLGGISQDFSVSFRFPQVTLFGKSTAIYDWKIRTIRKSAARWRGRRARGYRKLIFCANLHSVPNIKMQRRLRSRSLHNFGTCAWRTNARWQNLEKKTSFDAGKIGFCHCTLVLQAKEPTLCTDLDLSLLYILIFGTYSKFARKINFLARKTPRYPTPP